MCEFTSQHKTHADKVVQQTTWIWEPERKNKILQSYLKASVGALMIGL
jgi:hypothetical protein